MKSFIRGFAAVFALFAFSAIAASAQINYSAQVEVPFEFNVGEKAYEAGKYTIKINKQMVAGAALTIQRAGSDEAQTILLGNGGGTRSDEVQLIFNSIDGRKYLTGVTNANNEFAVIAGRDLDKRLAKARENGKSKTSRL